MPGVQEVKNIKILEIYFPNKGPQVNIGLHKNIKLCINPGLPSLMLSRKTGLVYCRHGLFFIVQVKSGK